MWWIELSAFLVTMASTRLPDRVQRVGARLAAQSTVEYALVGALVVIAAAGAMTILGGQLTNVFTNISNTLKTASTGK